MAQITLILLSEIEEKVLEALKESLQETFDVPVQVRAAIRGLDPAYDARTGQYVSPRLLSRLRRFRKEPDDRILGIVDVDIYSPGFDFVFGEAEIESGVGALSLYRLRPETYGLRPDMKLLAERAVKEAVHELGHLYYLGHCPNAKCVMHFSVSLSDVDRKRKTFCAKCQRRLEGQERIRAA